MNVVLIFILSFTCVLLFSQNENCLTHTSFALVIKMVLYSTNYLAFLLRKTKKPHKPTSNDLFISYSIHLQAISSFIPVYTFFEENQKCTPNSYTVIPFTSIVLSGLFSTTLSVLVWKKTPLVDISNLRKLKRIKKLRKSRFNYCFPALKTHRAVSQFIRHYDSSSSLLGNCLTRPNSSKEEFDCQIMGSSLEADAIEAVYMTHFCKGFNKEETSEPIKQIVKNGSELPAVPPKKKGGLQRTIMRVRNENSEGTKGEETIGRTAASSVVTLAFSNIERESLVPEKEQLKAFRKKEPLATATFGCAACEKTGSDIWMAGCGHPMHSGCLVKQLAGRVYECQNCGSNIRTSFLKNMKRLLYGEEI